MAEIAPEVWSMMLKIPGWTPPDEAVLLRHIIEGNARIMSCEHSSRYGFFLVKTGIPSDMELEEGIETMIFLLEKRLNRLRENMLKTPYPPTMALGDLGLLSPTPSDRAEG